MLQITADTFSGRPNPSWIVADETEARTTLREVLKDRQLLSNGVTAGTGLGFRGLLLEAMSDELARDFSLTEPTYLALGPNASSRSRELASRLVDLMGRGESSAAAAHDALPLEAPLHEFLATQLEYTSRSSVADAVEDAAAAATGETARTSEVAAVTCTIELGAFNPNFWNNDANIRAHNNYYNYASNKRTDTFAQPGRGCGNMYKAITCTEMSRASLCDGLHRRFTCFPDSLLVAGFQARPSPVECERSVEDAKSQLECGD